MKRKLMWGVMRPSTDKNGLDSFQPYESKPIAEHFASSLNLKLVRGAIYR